MNGFSLDIKGIYDYQKNRPPYLLIDYVNEVIPGKSANGYKNLKEDEWFFKVHWPGDPNMPGLLQIEALVQMCALTILTLDGNKGKNITSHTQLYSEYEPNEKFHFVKYEELVRNPVDEMARIAQFLQITNLASLQYPSNFGNRWGGNSSSMGEFKGVESNRLNKWTQELSNSEIRIIEYFLCEYLTQARYLVQYEQRNRLRILADIIWTETKSITSSFRVSARGVYYAGKHLVVMIKSVYSCLFDIKYLGR